MNEGIKNMMHKLTQLRSVMQREAVQWDSSRPFFFLLDEAIEAAGLDIQRIELELAGIVARKQLEDISHDKTPA